MEIKVMDFSGVRVDNSHVDYPRAWQICRATTADQHHPKCSYRTHGLLCDCDVLTKHPEYLGK